MPLDPIQQFLENQRLQQEEELMMKLHGDNERRLRELKQQVPDGRHDLPGSWAPEERFPGDYPDEIGGWRLA